MIVGENLDISFSKNVNVISGENSTVLRLHFLGTISPWMLSKAAEFNSIEAEKLKVRV